MKNKEAVKINLSIETREGSDITIGKSGGVNKDLEREVFDSISKALGTISDKWLEDYCEKIKQGDFEAAYEVFHQNEALLGISQDNLILDKLNLMDVSKITKDSRKGFLLSVVAYACRFGRRGDIEHHIDEIVTEFEDELGEELMQNLLLEKANIASSKGLNNKALILYKRIENSNKTSAGTMAWVYQGLSINSSLQDDIIYYAEKALDKHLEAGNQENAIRNIIVISDLKASSSPEEAISLLDYAMSLLDGKKLLERDFLASIMHKKSSYLYEIGSYKEGLLAAEESCKLREGLIGNEVHFHSSLSLACNLAKLCGDLPKANHYKKRAENLTKIIHDPDFLVRNKLVSMMDQGKSINEELLVETSSTSDSTLRCGALIYNSSQKTLQIEDSLELLDQAETIAIENKDGQMLSLVYFAMAEQYNSSSFQRDALLKYKKCLIHNPFYQPAFINCSNMLINNEMWEDAEIFIEKKIDKDTNSPGMCFLYGRVLYENKQYKRALKYLTKSDRSIPKVVKYISECVAKLGDEDLEDTKLTKATPHSISSRKFKEALEEFSVSISSDSRMQFWNIDKETRKYKWTKNPEELSKQMLINFLNGKFGKKSIEIHQESRAGAGFIDLYVSLEGGLKVVIELKMCGSGYSSSYAVSGESQIVHYQENKQAKLGFLIVFDSRTRDFGKKFKDIQTVEEKTIHTIAIDVRPSVIQK